MSGVSGTLNVGEASATIKEVMSRLQGGRGISSFIAVLTLVVCAGVGGVLWRSNQVVGIVAGVVVGLILWVFLYQRLSQYLYRRRFSERGFPLLLPLSIAFTDEALDYTLGDVREIAKWSAVTEIFPSHGYWIFLAQGSPFYVPERFFQTKSEERDFIRAALSHMSEAALACSPGAVNFAK